MGALVLSCKRRSYSCAAHIRFAERRDDALIANITHVDKVDRLIQQNGSTPNHAHAVGAVSKIGCPAPGRSMVPDHTRNLD